jgi:hypothetical protein
MGTLSISEKNSDTTGFSRVEFQFQPNARAITALRAAPPRVEGKDGVVQVEIETPCG